MQCGSTSSLVLDLLHAVSKQPDFYCVQRFTRVLSVSPLNLTLNSMREVVCAAASEDLLSLCKPELNRKINFLTALTQRTNDFGVQDKFRSPGKNLPTST